MLRVREFGVARGFEQLVRAELPAVEADGHDLLAVAVYALGAHGFWLDNTEDLALFFALLEFT